MVIQPGKLYYDDYLDAHYLVVDHRDTRGGRRQWLVVELESGELRWELERMIAEDPDVEWLE